MSENVGTPWEILQQPEIMAYAKYLKQKSTQL